MSVSGRRAQCMLLVFGVGYVCSEGEGGQRPGKGRVCKCAGHAARLSRYRIGSKAFSLDDGLVS